MADPRAQRIVAPFIVGVFLLLIWQGLVRFLDVPEYQVPAPSALPYFYSGLRISCGMSLIGAVVAEFVAGTGGTGLAYQVLQAGFEINIPRLFASLLMITVTGVLLFGLMVALSRLALSRWHESEVGQE